MGSNQLSELKAQAICMVDDWCKSILSWYKNIPTKNRIVYFIAVNIYLVLMFVMGNIHSEFLIMDYLTGGIAGELLTANKESYWTLVGSVYGDERLIQLSRYILLDNLIGISWLLICCYMLIFGKFSPGRFALLSIACFVTTTVFVNYPLLDNYTDFFSEKMSSGYMIHGFFTVCLVFLLIKGKNKPTTLGYKLVVNLVFFWLCWKEGNEIGV